MKDKLPEIITSGSDLGGVLQYLTFEQYRAVTEAMQDKPPEPEVASENRQKSRQSNQAIASTLPTRQPGRAPEGRLRFFREANGSEV